MELTDPLFSPPARPPRPLLVARSVTPCHAVGVTRHSRCTNNRNTMYVQHLSSYAIGGGGGVSGGVGTGGGRSSSTRPSSFLRELGPFRPVRPPI